MNQKSSICAIICEYDPFHNGHKYQIEQARLLSGCDFVLCLMSGSLVQRGYPAILDKHTRAKLALQNGADMVVLLPTVFATSSAQDFATGAIKMLDTLGVQCLCFGVEPSCLSSLEDCKNWDFAKLKTLSKDFSKQGANSAKAYQLAVSSLYGTQHATAFENPNFVLAYEYQKALHFANSKILTLPIARTNAYHHLDLATPFASATAIRHAQRTQQDISQFVPYEPSLLQNTLDSQLFESILALHLKNTDLQTLSQIHGVTEGLHYRLKKVSDSHATYAQILQHAKSKRTLHARLRRILLHNYLGVTKQTVQLALQHDLPYQVLGIKNTATTLLGQMPPGTILGKKDLQALSPSCQHLLAIESKADTLYSVITQYCGDLLTGNGIIKI